MSFSGRYSNHPETKAQYLGWGPSLLGTEFARDRVCQGSSLLGAEMSTTRIPLTAHYFTNALFGVGQMLSGEKDHVTSEMRVIEKGACKKE